MDDALFGPDGTQASPPPPVYPDALGTNLKAGARPQSPAQPVRTRPPAPVKPPKPRDRPPRQDQGRRRRPAAPPAPTAQTAAAPAPYEAPQSVAPARRAATAPRRRSGANAVGWLVTLLILGSVGFSLLQGVLRDLGILR